MPNRLGFKGSEDLGNGTKVIFELEAGFLADDGTNSIPGAGGVVPGTGPVFRRHSWVGLTGEWGTVLGGRVDGARYGVAGRYDPFEQGGVANMASLQGHVTRGDNAIAYVTPNIEGLYAVLAYTPSLIGQELLYNTGDIRDWIIQPNYVQGPLSVTLNYEHLTVHNDANETKIYTTFFAVPEELLNPAEEARLVLAESPKGSPEQLKAWYYPGLKTGFEFVSPKPVQQALNSNWTNLGLPRGTLEKSRAHDADADTRSEGAEPDHQADSDSGVRLDLRNQLQLVHLLPFLNGVRGLLG